MTAIRDSDIDAMLMPPMMNDTMMPRQPLSDAYDAEIIATDASDERHMRRWMLMPRYAAMLRRDAMPRCAMRCDEREEAPRYAADADADDYERARQARALMTARLRGTLCRRARDDDER